jgi:hypothetical protein
MRSAILGLVLLLPLAVHAQDLRIGNDQTILSEMDGGPEKFSATAIRAEAEWADFKKKCSPRVQEMLKTAKIDFTRDMLVVVALGKFEEQLTVDEQSLMMGLCGVTEEKERIVVHLTVVYTNVYSGKPLFPVFVARIPRSEKKVEFERHYVDHGA